MLDLNGIGWANHGNLYNPNLEVGIPGRIHGYRGFSFAHGKIVSLLFPAFFKPLPNGKNGMILQVTYQSSKLRRVDCLKWLFLVGLDMGVTKYSLLNGIIFQEEIAGPMKGFLWGRWSLKRPAISLGVSKRGIGRGTLKFSNSERKEVLP